MSELSKLIAAATQEQVSIKDRVNTRLTLSDYIVNKAPAIDALVEAANRVVDAFESDETLDPITRLMELAEALAAFQEDKG